MAAKKITELSAGTITDSKLLFVGDPATGALTRITGAQVKAYAGGGPLTYAVIISQSGSGAPTIDFAVTNTTGLTFTWARTSNGTYTLTASGSFFAGVTIPTFTTSVGAFGYTISHVFTSATVLTIYVRSFAGSFVDSALDHAVVKLEQYV